MLNIQKMVRDTEFRTYTRPTQWCHFEWPCV